MPDKRNTDDGVATTPPLVSPLYKNDTVFKKIGTVFWYIAIISAVFMFVVKFMKSSFILAKINAVIFMGAYTLDIIFSVINDAIKKELHPIERMWNFVTVIGGCIFAASMFFLPAEIGKFVCPAGIVVSYVGVFAGLAAMHIRHERELKELSKENEEK